MPRSEEKDSAAYPAKFDGDGGAFILTLKPPPPSKSLVMLCFSTETSRVFVITKQSRTRKYFGKWKRQWPQPEMLNQPHGESRDGRRRKSSDKIPGRVKHSLFWKPSRTAVKRTLASTRWAQRATSSWRKEAGAWSRQRTSLQCRGYECVKHRLHFRRACMTSSLTL
jgi:hypothetical protein